MCHFADFIVTDIILSERLCPDIYPEVLSHLCWQEKALEDLKQGSRNAVWAPLPVNFCCPHFLHGWRSNVSDIVALRANSRCAFRGVALAEKNPAQIFTSLCSRSRGGNSHVFLWKDSAQIIHVSLQKDSTQSSFPTIPLECA